MNFQTVYPLTSGKLRLLTLDSDEHGNFIALLSNWEVWTNQWRLALQQQFRFPLIRKIDDTRFLIVESRRGPQDNGHVFGVSGNKLLTFNAGDAVEAVLVQDEKIVISYFDEGIGSGKPSSDGLAVFNFDGQQLWGFNSSNPAHFILDCYCMCKLGKDSILFYPYTDFPLLELRLTDYQVTHQQTPDDFCGSHALTTTRGNVIFCGSYEDTCFFWWDRKDKIKRFGDFPPARLRGIGNGKFLTFDDHSFTIVDAMAVMREK
ncbi:hypothetical protein [Hymenobacter psychrotolerans]|uniref:Uncharacterized protein n=1 Tax=Hymenobacter psychrotolerans DSM 18569 TaxID=1121959 RepID=A0A1M6QCM9_9BACT|nr:hypothetical protein [Hymenobacter psychrotolerans]SHK17928.1 hypothetical protein SAMN02746009_00519 [Hymenobacter psychrotolerans DSM 18569]